MRIERINENSIRCTLTSFDLSVRNLNLRELAYGSEKAKKLFDEMMTKAGNEVGFHADNTPIMIEAIPMGTDSIQLIISKVPDPEELDTRFSRFTKGQGLKPEAEDWISRLTSALLEGAGGFASQLQKMAEARESAKDTAAGAQKEAGTPEKESEESAGGYDNAPEFRVFAFPDLERVIQACRAASHYPGFSRLYKSPLDGHYVLLIRLENTDQDSFSKACNVVAEYGRMVRTVSSTPAYYEEHYTVITSEQAIQKLGQL